MPRLRFLVLLLGLGAWTQAIADAGDTPAPEEHSEPRHVLLISIDSLRADHLPFHGYPRSTAPFLASLAGRPGSVVFDRMSAVSPSCHPSHTTILTGLYPQQVGIPLCGEDLIFKRADLEESADADALVEAQEQLAQSPDRLVRKRVSAVMNLLSIPEGVATLATHLKQSGYVTAGFPSIWTIHSRHGYARGFDLYQDDLPSYYGPKKLAILLRDIFKSQRRRHGEDTLRLVQQYLDEHDPSKPLFLFVHFADTHVPYRAPAEVGFGDETPEQRAVLEQYRAERYSADTLEQAMQKMAGKGEKAEHLLDAYDRSIRHVDSLIAALFRHLEHRGMLDDTFVVITADHGDSFGQHRYLSRSRVNRLFFEHSVYLWEETQHVPLLVHDPSSTLPARHHAGNVSSIDIVPTILAAVGQDKTAMVTGKLPGRDIANQESPDDPRRVYFLTFGRGRPGLLRDVFLDFPRFIGFREGDTKFFVDRDRFRDAEHGRCFLYGLAGDPHEQHNLCAMPEHSKRAQRFRNELVTWYNATIEGRRTIPRRSASLRRGE